jgi:hypothetical protein
MALFAVGAACILFAVTWTFGIPGAAAAIGVLFWIAAIALTAG